MPVIDVTMLEGRTTEMKAALIRELTDVAERVLGVPRETVRVLVRELPYGPLSPGPPPGHVVAVGRRAASLRHALSRPSTSPSFPALWC